MDAAASFELDYLVYDGLLPKFILFFNLAVNKYNNWDVHEDSGDETVKGGTEEDGQDNQQTTES